MSPLLFASLSNFNRRRLIVAGKLLLAAVLIGAVTVHFARLLRKPELAAEPTVLHPPLLIAAGMLYLTAHTLWATVFVQLLRSTGQPVGWRQGVRAYFVSQLGKYVPGKAWVIVLRAGVLRQQGLNPVLVGVAATYEALTSMAAGALLAVMLLPWAGLGDLLPKWAWLVLGGLALLPAAAGALHKVGAKIAEKKRGQAARWPAPPSTVLMLGLAQCALGWCLLAVGLWCTVEGLSFGDGRFDLERLLMMLAAVSLSYVAGFVILVTPGGLGARELVLQMVLFEQFKPHPAAEGRAVVVALVVRLVWTAAEVLLAVTLYWIGRKRVAIPSPSTSGVESGSDDTPIA